MDSFYRNWLLKNKKENQEAMQLLNNSNQIGPASATTSTSEQPLPQPSVHALATTSSSDLPSVATSATISTSQLPSVTSSASSSQLPSVTPSTSNQNLPSTSRSTSEQLTSRNQNVSDLFYENEQLQMFIEKADHIKQIKFRLQDHLFHMKIQLKPGVEPPLMRDILNFLEIGFNHILTNIKTFYKPEDHNIAFLTLYQEPMINGLNTGGFDIQETSFEMVERVLKMLEQFLVSNQTLRLNDTFKVYLKVLSIEHLKFKANFKQRIHPKRTKQFYKKKHFGARNKTLNQYNFFWALDVPDSYPNEPHLNIFQNKCLITACILGLLQHAYFESKRSDKRFIHAQNINSQNKDKKNHAGNILARELHKLFDTTMLPREGPYELEATVQKLSEVYNCQFFIFDNAVNSNKLTFMFPANYNDCLKPIFLFQPNDAKNHLIFIRNLNSYFKANVKVCFPCKKTFLTHNYRHLCLKGNCCFSCHRFFQSRSTYVHEKLAQNFCDGKITAEVSFTCFRCNVTCYSKHCFQGHKILCSGKGTFGFKCLKCKKFTYRYGKMCGSLLKINHRCGEDKRCLYCREINDVDHLCKLNKEKCLPNSSRLAFIGMEHFSKLLSSDYILGQNEPIFVIVYKEDKIKGKFTKYVLHNFTDKPTVSIFEDELNVPYDDSPYFSSKKLFKKTQDLKSNCENLQNKEAHSLITDQLLQLFLSDEWQNTTFICQDSDSENYVRNLLIIETCDKVFDLCSL